MARYEIAENEIVQANIPGVSKAEELFQKGMAHSTFKHFDAIKAHKWFNLSAMMGNKKAVEFRQEVAEQMSSAEISEAQREAREWLSLN